jgi:RNA polymerase sigma-70 factor (ECF subfamily)
MSSKSTTIPTDAHVVMTVFRDHRITLFRYARTKTKCAADAEDVVSETMLRIVEGRIKLQEERLALPILYRVAHNLCIDGFRTAQTRQRLGKRYQEERKAHEPHLEPPDKSVLSDMDEKLLLEAFQRLSDKRRQALQMTHENRSTEEIAAAMNIAPHTVERHFRDAMAQLLEELDELNGVEPERGSP